MRIIGLHGHAGVGKDTVADFLHNAGYERIAFADQVRLFLAELNPWVVNILDSPTHLSTLLQRYNWDVLKRQEPFSREIRPLLQQVGEAARAMMGDDVWIRALLTKLDPGKNYVVSDIRYRNERDAIADLRPSSSEVLLVKIVRPGYGPLNAHVSEAGLSDDLFDVVLTNEGDLDQLQAQVAELARWGARDASVSTAA